MRFFKKRSPKPPIPDAKHVTLGPMWHEGVQANVEVISLFFHHWLQGSTFDGERMIVVVHKGATRIALPSDLSSPRHRKDT